jgi:hypothetical protein
MAPVKRAISPTLNPAGLMATAGAVYAATVMILNAYHGHGVIDPPVIIAAVGAVAALLTRQVVTPVADPKDGNGNPLVTPPPPGPAPPGIAAVTPPGWGLPTTTATQMPPLPPATGGQT